MILKYFAITDMGLDTPEFHKEILIQNLFIDDLVCDLIGKKYKTPVTAKIVVCICDANVKEQNGFVIRKNKANILLDIVEYTVDFDFEFYKISDRLTQKKYFWKICCDSIIDCARQLNWDLEPLSSLYEKGLLDKRMTEN